MNVQYNLDGDVAVITLDRPDRFNSVEAELSEGVIGSMDRAATEARAVVLTGAGKAFCAGADLANLLDDYDKGGPDLAAFLDEVFHPMVHSIVNAKVPVVAAVNGVAAGAGLGVALGCDMRVMAESAFLTSAFTAIGLAPDSGTTWWLPHMVGVSKALELTMTNRRVGADEARTLGLVAEVVPDDQVVEKALEVANSLADLVPDSLVTTRALIRGAAGKSFEEALTDEQWEQGRLGRTPAHREGVDAFLEKRKAEFRKF
ncbi:MAG: enoyl-CoA hydratase-related protein [Actinomycetota bacterium]|nr:enoyl-CoA hydratase-related protein [Actinomycetota bacterium]